jgi:hypothetical protein
MELQFSPFVHSSALGVSADAGAVPLLFDFFGLATFALGMTGLQLLLDRGERLDWFMMIALLAVSPLVAFLHKPQPNLIHARN